MAPPAADPDWLAGWRNADELAAEAILGALAEGGISEPEVASELGVLLPEEATLFVASSMPVRDIETFWPAREDPPRVLCNRGANGIDGTVSSAFGAAAAGGGPVLLLIGDVALAHDIGGLLAAERLGLKLTIVLLDNGGGGIFDFLPISQARVALAEGPHDRAHAAPHGDRASARTSTHATWQPPPASTSHRRRTCTGWRMSGSRISPRFVRHSSGRSRGDGSSISKSVVTARRTSSFTAACGTRCPARSARQQREQGRQLDLRLGQLLGRAGLADDAVAGVAAGDGTSQQRTAKRDTKFAVSGRVGPTDRACVPPTVQSLERRDERSRPGKRLPPTAGVGCISPASSSASIGAASWARIGVARCWMLAIFTNVGSGAAATQIA